MGTAIPVFKLSIVHLPEAFFTLFAAKLLAVFTAIIKPRLTALEVRHRLVPIEGQKEIARRSKPCRKVIYIKWR